MVYNQQNPYTIALVVLDPDRVRAWMKEKGLDSASDAGLDEAIRHVAGAFRAYKEDPSLGSRFIATWTPRTFAILPEPFSEENRMINSTLKMVRRIITATYAAQIEGLYAQNADPVGKANREALRALLARSGAR